VLDSLITSKTRIKLLLKFFLNSETQGYLRGLASEFNESTNAVRIELNRLSEAGLLDTAAEGRTKVYKANNSHPLFPELNSLVRKYSGIDKVEYFISQLGEVDYAYLTGDYAKGQDTGIIDIVLVGVVNREKLDNYIEKTEGIIKRKIRAFVVTPEEFEQYRETLKLDEALLIWTDASLLDEEESDNE
jgi:hypothetical protein